MSSYSPSPRGFTLIEFSIVGVIIVILALGAVPTLSIAQKKARDVRRITDISETITALNLFFNANKRHPGISDGISEQGEMIGDDFGPFERALDPYMAIIPPDPRHDGIEFYYAYDPTHPTDEPYGSCNPVGKKALFIGFQTAESNSLPLKKHNCGNPDMNFDNADYVISLFPAGE